MSRWSRAGFVVFLGCLSACLAIVFAQIPKLPDVGGEISDRMPGTDEILKSKPPITTSIADAKTEVPFLDDFNSEDVKFTIEYLKNFSFYYDRFSSITNIIILDDYTVDFKASNTDSLLLYDLILANILSKDYMLSILDTNESWPIGTGAYKLKEYIPDDHITLERFDDYWKGRPQIKQVNFIVEDGPEELLNGVIDGDLDIAPISFDFKYLSR